MKKAFLAILRVEARLALRGGDMLLFGILFPVAVMLLTGFVMGPEKTALGFAGISAIGICAGGLMGVPLTFAGYRHARILRRYRVTPTSPTVLLVAVAAVQTAFALVSGIAVYLVASGLFGVRVEGGFLRFALTFCFVVFPVFSVGFLVASLVPNERAANVACSVLYFPTLFASGATVPYEILPRPLTAVMDWVPLTEGIKLLKGATVGSPASADLMGFLALALLGALSCVVAARAFRWE